MLALLNIEKKIVGSNILWITLLLLGSYIALCVTGGDLVNWVYLGFEVMLPFYAAISVCEWVRTRSDPVFELVLAQAKSLFFWVVRRFLLVFLITTVLAFIGMIVLRQVALEFSLCEVLFTYVTTAFCISSLGLLASFFSSTSHVASAICGTLWLFSLLAKSILKYRAATFFYLFLRFAEPDNPVWFTNKVVLVVLGLLIWLMIWLICHKRYILQA